MDVWQQISQKSPLVLLRDFSLDTKYVTALRHGKQRISLIIIQQTVYTHLHWGSLWIRTSCEWSSLSLGWHVFYLLHSPAMLCLLNIFSSPGSNLFGRKWRLGPTSVAVGGLRKITSAQSIDCTTKTERLVVIDTWSDSSVFVHKIWPSTYYVSLVFVLESPS